MSDFNRFVTFLSDYLSVIKDSTTDRSGVLASFVHNIQELKCKDFRWYYFVAVYQYKIGAFNEASVNIGHAIQLLQQIKDVNTQDLDEGFEQKENSKNLFTTGGSKGFIIGEVSAFNLRSNVYFYGGEIYSKVSQSDKALTCYQSYQYIISQLKSEFESDIENGIVIHSYRAINQYSLADMINNTITVSPPSMMNDSFDSLYTLWISQDSFENNCKEKTHIELFKKSFEDYRIRSFTKGGPKNVLMWSHYANEHSGICVEYCLSNHFIKEESNDENRHMYLKLIDYSQEAIMLDKGNINTNIAFVTKKTDWAYEKEVRLISYKANRNEVFDPIPLDVKSYVKGIYFGYRCDDTYITTIKNIFKCTAEKMPSFYRMRLNPKDVYNLIVEQI